MSLTENYDEIARCNRCGFCQVACPIFRATGHEAGVARGRVALLRGLVEERVAWDNDLQEPLFNCLLCGACTSNCFPAVGTADLIQKARGEYLDRVGRSKLHRFLFQHLLPFPKRLRLAARAAASAKNRGLTKLARALGLLRIFGRDFSRAEEIVNRFPDRMFRDQLPAGPIEGTGDLRIGYFVGCGTDILCPEAAQATLQVLRRIGRTVQVLENCCCGLPAMTYGDRAAAQNLAEKNLRLFQGGPFDVLVADCSSCAAFLKKYPALFAEDDPRRQAAAAQAARVRDLVQLIGQGATPPRAGEKEARAPSGGHSPERPEGGLAQVGPVFSPAQTEKIIVTYHDPCHASRGQGLVRDPREFLRSLSGVEFREMAEADWCCGGAGSYALSHYELAQKVLDRKIDNLERSGAAVLVTSCPACIIHLRYGVRRRGLPVRVCHIAEFLTPRGSCGQSAPSH
jgi:glycolate oxidase iron-sulfur subunit